MTTCTKPYFQEQILEKLKTLVNEAKLLGLVLTIDTVSKEPLAMGNVEMVPHLREARNIKYIRGEVVQTIAKVKKDKNTLRVYAYGGDYLLGNTEDGIVTLLGIINTDQYHYYLRDIVHVN